MAFIEQVTHPHIVRVEDIANGKPIISGTRVKVEQIALEYERLGWTPDQIVEAHPHLTLAQVHDALCYYYDHQAEIDAQVSADEEIVEEVKQRFAPKLNDNHED